MLADIPNLIKMFLIGPFPQGPLGGLAINVFLAVITMASGFILGLFLALGRISKNIVIRRIVTCVIEITRALPLLLIVFWFYFFIPLLAGRPLPILLSAYLSLTFYSAVNQAEIFRGGLTSIDKGQWQVASCTGLSHYQCMTYIILPQVLRMMLPSFVGFLISLFKDTSVIYIIGIIDLTQIGIMLSQREPDKLIFSYILVAMLYFILCFILSHFAKKWESKQARWSK
ncbi:amino acid ABC transporter permease [Ruminiclostridium cellulolyticum]|uniref:Polar amino acid ABC transporter, inner membrane subunit n=1 Tax=Ruminiclostridium cellulolyticum (strain ATCC 35319 / DSM 5812 / JCM 6584 / H10) TaxID=394503 RepID=B8I2I9_RUMCH|nr:amino acid ABC transporter permease [Ruminiclostridium cellulolyticum]ACL75982.1 polar amino acid ABC transporter, inner membrane subunit [Ruminiclostridium cellulolyticum H10]